jgi:PTH1 family peptidyl-tRNA hydrolase
MGAKIFLVVGLGNPGNDYATTRHNAGFLVVDELARRFGASVCHNKWQAYFAQLERWGNKIFFIKPDTFMNLSGKAVARYVDFYKVEPDRLLVIHDDLDMNPGRVKLVAGGGAGGHNGIRSLVEWLGTGNFLRLKLGIGRPGKLGVHSEIPVEKYVLAPFSPDEKKLLDERMDSIEKGLEYLVRDGLSKAMNLLNSIKT